MALFPSFQEGSFSVFVLGLTGDELNTTTTEEPLQDDLVQALPFSPEVMGVRGGGAR